LTLILGSSAGISAARRILRNIIYSAGGTPALAVKTRVKWARLTPAVQILVKRLDVASCETYSHKMRFLLTISLISVAIPALAAESSLVSGPVAAGQAGVTASTATAANRTDADVLDDLFRKLAKARTPVEAQSIENDIVARWTMSGSGTVDLFMAWAHEAVNKQNYARALDLFDQVVVLKPDFSEAYNRRAGVYYEMGDFDRALADIRTTLAFEPRHFGALSGLAMILIEIGDTARAAEIYRRLLEIDPQLQSAREVLDRLEEDKKGSPL
jgi:tetratricopeptide (TPR) repeat protein